MVEAQASQCQIHIVEHLIGEIKQYQKAHGAERILVCYKTVILFNFLERTRRRSMGLKKNKNQKQNPHQNSALPRDWILKSPAGKPLQMTVCATTCESRKQSVADRSELIIRRDSTEHPEQP